MSDKWMNIGYDDDQLKPYQDKSFDDKDQARLGWFAVGSKRAPFFVFQFFASVFIVFVGGRARAETCVSACGLTRNGDLFIEIAALR